MTYVLTDACSGKQGTKQQYTLFAGFDFLAGCCFINACEAHVIAKGGGDKIAQGVQVDLDRFFITNVGGSATDNASDVRIGFVRAMQLKHPFFIPIGCLLHVFNLMLMCSIHASFGKAAMGVCSALRLAYVVPYLMQHFPESWVDYATKNGSPEVAKVFVGASEGRWWSIKISFDDVYEHRELVLGWLMYMSNATTANGPDQTSTSSYQSIFVEAASWLQNNKVHGYWHL